MKNLHLRNPRAFPQAFLRHEDEEGMTLRDYFAAKAMQSLLGDLDMFHVTSLASKENGLEPTPGLARAAYAMADSMLAERAKVSTK